MSESAPSVPGDVAPRYWSPARVLLAIVMIVLVFGAAGYSVWDDVHRLLWGQPTPPGSTGYAAVYNLEEAFDWSGLTIDRGAILSGGPTKDGIPSLTDPPRLPVAEADFLPSDARVIGVTLGDESRAYPIGVLNWHEIINDTLGGTPIAVIYCPLCDSASLVDRRIDGYTLEFGVSGLLINSNVLLYDRKTDGLWSQVKLEAISGPYAGRSLRHLGDWSIGSFGDWKADHPDGTVVAFDTGHHRDYRRNPYESYFSSDILMFPAEPLSDALPHKEPVFGVILGDAARAYPVEAIDGELRDTLAGREIVLRGDGNGGIIVEGLPDEARAVHTFWFAWHAFHPDTTIYVQAE